LAEDTLETTVLFRDWIKTERRNFGILEIIQDDDAYNEIQSTGDGRDADEQVLTIPSEESQKIIEQLRKSFKRNM